MIILDHSAEGCFHNDDGAAPRLAGWQPIDRERLAIGMMLIDPGFAARWARQLRPESLDDGTARSLLRAVRRELKETGMVDPGTVLGTIRDELPASEVRSLGEELRDLADFWAADRAEPAARWLLRRQGERDLAIQFEDIVADDKISPAAKVEMIRGLALDDGRELGTTLADVLVDPADEPDERLHTGIDWLDQAVGGGFHLTAKLAFAGEPGVGKTALALQATVGFLMTNPDLCLVWCAGEMSLKQLRNRLLCCMSGLTLTVLRRPWSELSPLQGKAKREALEDARSIADRLHFEGPPLMPGAMEAKVGASGARVLVVDYLQLCRPDGEASSRRDAIDSVLVDLVAMTNQRKLVLWLVSDTPKPNGNAKWDIYSAFKESSEIGFAVDIAYVGEHPDGQPDDGQDVTRVNWRCLKNRHDRRRSMLTNFDQPVQQFRGTA